MVPDFEKILSELTEVAVIDKYFIAIGYNLGNKFLL